MDNSTVINPAIRTTTSTVMNREIIEEYNRQNNIKTDISSSISEGTEICGKYRVKSQLEVSSGEADLFLCSDGSSQYVAKIYKRRFAIKQDVIEALRKIDSPYVARLYDTGSFEDLKPSNIMMNSDGETVSIIDFGISSIVEDGNTVLVTKTGMTPEYSAPETFKNIFLRESDYYSFGITVFELICGYTPYANMQPEEINQYFSVQRIPYPEEMPLILQDFISALTYFDISNRNNKNNPNRRWTYDEVKKWLNGEPLIIPGEGIGNVGKGKMPAYRFREKDFTDPALLVTAFARNWEDGKKELFRGKVTAHFRRWNQEIARKCQAAEEEAVRENGKDDIIFWKLLYQLNPRLKGFYWMGRTYESLPAFGRDVLEKLAELPEKPDYIVLDPPREGINPKALGQIIDYGVGEMVYISCKASSFKRDKSERLEGEEVLSGGPVSADDAHRDGMSFVQTF